MISVIALVYATSSKCRFLLMFFIAGNKTIIYKILDYNKFNGGGRSIQE